MVATHVFVSPDSGKEYPTDSPVRAARLRALGYQERKPDRGRARSKQQPKPPAKPDPVDVPDPDSTTPPPPSF